MKSKTLVVLYTAIIIAAMGVIMMFTVQETVSNSFTQQINREQDGRLQIARDYLLQFGDDFQIRNGNLYVGDTLINGNQQLVDSLGEIFGGIVTIFQDDVRVATNVRLVDGTPMVNFPLQRDAYDALFGDATEFAEGAGEDTLADYRSETEISGHDYVVSYGFLRDPTGAIIGIIQVGSPMAPYEKALGDVMWRTTLVTLGAIVIVGVIVFFALNRLSIELAKITGRAQALLNSTREGVFGMDLEGRCTFINEAGCMFLGYTPEELRGEDMAKLVRPPAPEGSKSEVSFVAMADSDDLIPTEDEFVREDGTRFPVRYFVSPVVGSAGVEGCVLSFMNVTEEKKAAERLAEMTDRLESIIQSAQSAQRAKSAFFATTGNEISQSGKAIRQTANELIDARGGDQEVVDKLHGVRRAAQSLLLTNELITYLTELEAGRVKAEAKPVELDQPLRAGIDDVAEMAKDRNVTVELDRRDGVPTRVVGDAAKIEEVATQLLREAVLQTRDATVKLRVEKRPGTNEDEPELDIAVTGAPCQYHTDKLKELFDAYRDADDDAIRSFGSSGLGLMVARDLAQILGGSLRVVVEGGEPMLHATVKVKHDGRG